ncbi:RHS repeat-associated core domain-containing protein [Sorangium cellulosum]|uniref:RHS repeat-associated core domain-containing protein n=1 Tax=Sorangium cellulosum TaxID=56 RepID=UPI0016510DE4|nr:RHS repeat-associated core domain-containing protein [Sorangium cellulosum]
MEDVRLRLTNLRSQVYDPKLKRVLTPDPVVSAPLFGQSNNRYSYMLNDPMNLVDPTGYAPTGPDCTTCAPWTPPGEGGGGVTILSGGSGDGGDGNPYSRDGSADDRDDLGPPPPPQVVTSDVDGFQGAGAGAHQESLLVQLLNERARQDRLYHEALQRDTFRVTQWAMLGAGAALLVWSGGYALLAIEELSVFGGAVGMSSTQVAAANAASFALKAVPALLGEVWVLEGLSRNDPGRIADGLMMAASAGASFGEGLGAGPRAGVGVGTSPGVTRTATMTQESIEHIALRHFPTSGATGAGKFDTTSVRSVRSLINEAVLHGASRPNTRGRPGQIVEYNFGRPIGTDVSGAPAMRLRVVLTPGEVVKTAFPY